MRNGLFECWSLLGCNGINFYTKGLCLCFNHYPLPLLVQISDHVVLFCSLISNLKVYFDNVNPFGTGRMADQYFRCNQEKCTNMTILLVKHCQKHNGPMSMSTLTHSTPLAQSRSFNKLRNLGQTLAWFCLVKSEKYIEKL